MKHLFLSLFALVLWTGASAQTVPPDYFGDELAKWDKDFRSADYPRYSVDEYRAIADNLLAYQNEDGGWPKNLDWLSKKSSAEVVQALDKRHRLSTLDNKNVYSQVHFLSDVYTLTQDERYREAARRGMEYMLDTQYDNGGWRGWDADAITFNDDIIYGVLVTWQEVLSRKPRYDWVDDALRERIEQSWERGIEMVLKTQYVRDGVKTVWAQQYDHQTFQPVQARKYELPGLVAAESSDIVTLLMRIKNPSDEIVEAIESAVRWFEQAKIEGIRIETVEIPEAERTDPKIKRDRIVVEDAEATPVWTRYYELDTDRPFFCRRDGVKVYTLAEVPIERRVGYSWYGNWGEKVLKKYPSWRAKMERDREKARAKRK